MANKKSVEVNIGCGGFLILLALIFITLKLCNVIMWSWWWVLAPLWCSLAIVIIICIIIVIFTIIVELLK